MPNDIITIARYYGAHQAKLNPFLQQFVQNIADRSREYIRLYWREQDHLAYGLLTNERGSYSLMAAAMDRITPAHESEMSVRRRVDYRNPANQDLPREQGGRVDLWSYFDGFEYFLEFKRTYISPTQVHKGLVLKNAKNSWGALARLRQLRWFCG